MLVKNKTHYYSVFNKTYNVVPDNNSWEFQCSKRMSYGQRLYWEYKYCKSVGGQAFFYTFTYNDDSLPHFDFDRFNITTKDYEPVSMPCFNYAHIRLITNGIISKVLRRKFGSQLRYFVACERGEGKGLRGKGMNPHYHVIFFVFPLSSKIRKPDDPPYKRISPIQFCHLCKCTWQYQSSYNKSDYVIADYKTAKFGHCQPGDDLGYISDFDALSYVTKYVIKDSSECYDDQSVYIYFEHKFKKLGYTYHAFFSFYQYERLYGHVFDRYSFLQNYDVLSYFAWRRLSPDNRRFSYFDYIRHCKPASYFNLFDSFIEYFNKVYLPTVIQISYRDYVNKYSSKVRCSKSLGIYGLQFVKDLDSDPHFVLDKSDEVVSQPICLYYYRKIYMDTVKCPVTGNNLYVLNEKGIDLKCRKLPFVLRSTVDKLSDICTGLSNNSQSSDVWNFFKSCGFAYLSFTSLLQSPDFENLLFRYSVYRNVYEYRFYPSGTDVRLSSYMNMDDIVSDYGKFLTSNFYYNDYSDLFLITLVRKLDPQKYRSFSLHPVFAPYIEKFKLLEQIYQLWSEYTGQLKKQAFSESLHVRKGLNALKFASVS